MNKNKFIAYGGLILLNMSNKLAQKKCKCPNEFP